VGGGLRLTDLLLDTCACIWVSENASLSSAAVSALDDASDEGEPVFVSPFTAWEVGMLTSRGRLALTVPPLAWFQQLMAIPGFQAAPASAEILVAASFLPGTPPRDPADRILISTARRQNLVLMTRDRLILDYADAGHVKALAC
jgi:PIN domain nuclease of toxin-antitoxin system